MLRQQVAPQSGRLGIQFGRRTRRFYPTPHRQNSTRSKRRSTNSRAGLGSSWPSRGHAGEGQNTQVLSLVTPSAGRPAGAPADRPRPRREADAQRIGGDRVADADLGELGDHVAERRQVVEVEVVAGVDAETRLLRRLGGLDVAPEQERRLAGGEGVGVGPGVELDPIGADRRGGRRWRRGPDP